MAELIGTVGAVVSLLGFTASLGNTIHRYIRAVDRVPTVINEVKTHVISWKFHLDELDRLSQRQGLNQHLKRFLQDNDVHRSAQECLERLNVIITKVTPPDQTRPMVAELVDQFRFFLKEDEVDDLLQQLDSNTKHLQSALTSNTMNSVEILRHDIGEATMAMVSAKESGTLFSWLEPEFGARSVDPERMQLEKSDLQEPHTCTWMTESPLWRDWLQGGAASEHGCRRFMWIHGLPGTGKTILASFLIDKLLDKLSPVRAVPSQYAKGFSYYYCHQEHDRDEALPFLRWVVRDLCKQLIPPITASEEVGGLFPEAQLEDVVECPRESPSKRPDRSIPKELYRMWQRGQMSIESLMECLQVIVDRFQSQHNKRVYIIVDAIDESKAPRDRLLDILTTIGSDTRFEKVSLLITSRYYQDIKGAIEDLPRVSLPMQTLVIRPPTTQQLLRPSTPGGPAFEPTVNPGSNNSRGMADPPKTPEKRDLKGTISRGQHLGEGFDPPTKSGQASCDRESNASGWGGRFKRNPTPIFAVGELGFQPAVKQSSPGKRSLANDERETSPTKRRFRETHVSPCTSLSMANPHVERAITIYIEARLRSRRRFQNWPNSAFLLEMGRTLAAKAGGIFRTVACHLDMIDRLNLTEESRILDCIRKMPDTIFDTYEQILVTLVPNGAEATREDREFARTALALMCSDTANIPDAGVLIAASRTTLPQLEAPFYTRVKLRKLLGCLIKATPNPRPRTVFDREDDDLPSSPLFSVAHYTVKEFLCSEKAANGPASYFAVSKQTNQILELKIVFEGLRHFDPNPRGTYKPTRYEEYCLEMTDKALSSPPVIVEEDEKLREAVFACLNINAPHRAWVSNRVNSSIVRQHFPTWNTLSPFEKVGVPSCESTSILVNLLLLQWPELAHIYLETLSVRRKEMIWCDTFKLEKQSRSLPQTTLVHMCVSRRRIDFLKIFTAHGVHFQDSRDDILFRALSDPYDKDDANGGTTLALLKVLLEHGADPNPEGFRVTPLQVATHYLERDWVHQLLSSHANVHAIGDATGMDPLPPTDETRDRQWYEYEPLKICQRRELDGRINADMQKGVEKVILRYLNGYIIVLES